MVACWDKVVISISLRAPVVITPDIVFFDNSKLLGPAPETLMQYWANNNSVYSQCSKWIAFKFLHAVAS